MSTDLREGVTLPAEVRAFIEELRAERAGLLDQLEKRSGLAHSLSEGLSEPEDDAAVGAAQRDTDRLEPMLERAARRIDAIQRVLERAVRGRLGACDRCGGAIGIERLRAVPETAHCVGCARELERRAEV
jgi:DnaK suppressor protein